MKIGILTHYNVFNLGAQLQMFCLKQWLEDRGFDVYILSYEKDFSFSKNEQKKNSGSFKNIFYYIKNYLLKNGYFSTIFYFKKLKKIRKTWKSLKFLPFDSNNLDYIIIGSDEVFSLDVGINKMMYGLNLKCSKVIAYAPSFGRTTIETMKERLVFDEIKFGLVNMYKLSARDTNTKNMLEKIVDREVPIVCDPVILFDINKFKTSQTAVLKRKFILIYSYDRNMKNKFEISEIKKFAKSHNLITVSVGTFHKWCDKNIVCDQFEWIEYFRNAEFVITDTFHGTVVSLKNKCNVAIYIRKNINNSKLSSLIYENKSLNRQIKEITCEELDRVYLNNYEYYDTEKALNDSAKNGEAYLGEALKCLN